MKKDSAAKNAISQVTTADVRRTGRVKNGYYWQLLDKKDGTVRCVCRSVHTASFQKHSACEEAGAKKPLSEPGFWEKFNNWLTNSYSQVRHSVVFLMSGLGFI